MSTWISAFLSTCQPVRRPVIGSPLPLLFAAASFAMRADAANLPAFDFTQAAMCSEWKAVHDIATLRPTPEGLEISIDGNDPYFHGPVRDYPADTPLLMTMRLKSEEGGLGQIFYFKDGPREENSTRFPVKAGEWTDVRAMLPALGAGYRLRIDPPGTGWRDIIASLRFESAAALAAPQWPKPEPADFSHALKLRSGAVELDVAERGFQVAVEGQRVAASHTRPLIGYVLGDQVRWLEASEPAHIEETSQGIEARCALRDPDGATWTITRSFSAGAEPGAIQVQTTIEANQDRDVAFLPLLLLVAFEGSADKGQALFPGLEYLENEPSSSEADLIGPESRRQVPANHKIAFPLMAVQKDERYVGLIWEHELWFSALFDSPDRLLNSGGHLMGALFPGSDGFNRREGDLMPVRTGPLRAGQPLTLKAQIIGGVGASVVPAIQQYVRLRGLPPVPLSDYSLAEYVSFAAHGWLDSKIREGNLFRHAISGSHFPARPSADAALYMDWLSTQTPDAALRDRLVEASRGALSAVPPDQWDSAGIGHVRYPAQSLVFGHVDESVEQHRLRAQEFLRRIRPDGTVAYQPRPDGPDYGRTHSADHANGLTAQVLAGALEAATFAGDRALIDDALAKLRLMQQAYAKGVPRGAQTWEVPLHTPDILAAAHLVRAFTMGFQLTDERELLDEAVYWAWTGLPFLYLINPVGADDQPYGCVTVFGATGWKAPVWIGRPVQWCGLVYADALFRLLPYDPSGPWKQIADGITAMGIRYSWPATDQERQGLLPDSWEVLALSRNAPPINPGTVQASAVRLFDQTPLYDCRVFLAGQDRVIVHAPGEIVPGDSAAHRLKFQVRAWPKKPYFVLLNGFARAPQVKIDGQPAPLTAPHEFQEKEGWLVLRLSGQPTVEAEWTS